MKIDRNMVKYGKVTRENDAIPAALLEFFNWRKIIVQ